MCTIPRDDHTIPPSPQTPYMSKKRQIHPPSKHHHQHHHPYIKFTNVQCTATPQREAAPATMASRGKSQGPDAGPDSQSAGVPPCPPSATARFPPSQVSPPHPACTNTDIHKNMNELWLGLLFQSNFSVGREEIPLTQQMGYVGANGGSTRVTGAEKKRFFQSCS